MNDVTNTAAPQELDAVPPPAPKYADNGRPRFRVVPLEWPIEYDGKTYSEITVRRMTTAEVVALVDQMRDDVGAATLPMFDVPREVIDYLDPDDADEVNKAVNDFLPRGLRSAE